jgi:DNA (cytosine-5)-methyltransferase 1
MTWVITNVDITQELPTVISFCSGYGGIERGLDLIGFEHRVIAYVEIEAYAIANLVNKMEAGLLPSAPIYTNLKTFPAHLFRDKVSLITGGYPCQPFSAAGERKGTDDPRHLWPYIRRHIEAIRPLQCFLENVEGHISLGLSSVVSDLEEDGYRTTWGIFSAREVGAPHQRKRVYILADSNGVRCDRGQLPNRVSERSMEIETQQRPEQSVVRSEVKRCCGKARRAHWPPEPGVGRVVDGCPDRVDRIRMLGNAVVPQTAAKAWVTLNDRMEMYR